MFIFDMAIHINKNIIISSNIFFNTFIIWYLLFLEDNLTSIELAALSNIFKKSSINLLPILSSSCLSFVSRLNCNNGSSDILSFFFLEALSLFFLSSSLSLSFIVLLLLVCITLSIICSFSIFSCTFLTS